MSQPYKVYISDEFVNRKDELKYVQTFLKERTRGVLIYEGERGSGKTSLLFEIYRKFHETTELQPFLISLLPYRAPEFESNKNIWINSERLFHEEELPNLLNQLARYMNIDFIESRDPDVQKEYLARGLAYRSAARVPVLLVDSIYECPENIRVQIEKYVLAPILTSERVFLILSGRGKRPVWSRPELQMAEIIKLRPLERGFVKEQLEKMGSPRVHEFEQIADLSGGYPLIVRVIGESKKTLSDALTDAIDELISDTLPEKDREGQAYLDIRSKIEKLSLVGIPFRILDVEQYLYPNNPEQRANTNNLFNLLLTSHILRYEGKGYQLNKSIVYPIRNWLDLHGRTSAYVKQLQDISVKLQNEYPSAKSWYQQMVPSNEVTSQIIDGEF